MFAPFNANLIKKYIPIIHDFRPNQARAQPRALRLCCKAKNLLRLFYLVPMVAGRRGLRYMNVPDIFINNFYKISHIHAFLSKNAGRSTFTSCRKCRKTMMTLMLPLQKPTFHTPQCGINAMHCFYNVILPHIRLPQRRKRDDFGHACCINQQAPEQTRPIL